MTLACGVVLQRLFTKACKGCKWFFLKDGTNVMFLEKIDLPYCLLETDVIPLVLLVNMHLIKGT